MGRPVRVAPIRGPPTALCTRSEAIAPRAGEEGRQRCAGPGRGRLYPRPQPQETAPLPRRGWDSGGHVGGGGDARGRRAGGGVAAPPDPGARRSLRLAGDGPPFLPAHPAGLDSSPRNPRTGIHFLGSAAWRPGLARVSEHPLPGF